MTDVLDAAGGARAVRTLLEKAPALAVATPAEATWWMSFGESVVTQVDRNSFQDLLEPLIDK
jgi:hypothetical protein